MIAFFFALFSKKYQKLKRYIVASCDNSSFCKHRNNLQFGRPGPDDQVWRWWVFEDGLVSGSIATPLSPNVSLVSDAEDHTQLRSWWLLPKIISLKCGNTRWYYRRVISGWYLHWLMVDRLSAQLYCRKLHFIGWYFFLLSCEGNESGHEAWEMSRCCLKRLSMC